MSSRRGRGNIAIIFALSLLVLFGFLALVVDFGYFFMVQGELQNGADAAALAGVRDLDGSSAKLSEARARAQAFGALHVANQTPIALDLNTANAADGDIVLGNWNFATRIFTVAGAFTPSSQVNAVKVVARRTTLQGAPVATVFAVLLGKTSKDLTATAIAVGGTPEGVCGFPLAVADCSLLDSDGNLRCNAELTFGQATTDTAGFTIYSASNPTTPTVTCMMAKSLGSPCPATGGCDCTQPCNATSTSDGEIKISNGNNLSETSVDNIMDAVLAAGAAGEFVQVAVIGSGVGASECGGFNYNQTHPIVGYVDMKLTGATFAPNKSVTASVDCTHSGAKPPGGDLYGYKSIKVYLAQ